MSPFHGDYLRENEMIENNMETAAWSQEELGGGFVSSVGRRDAKPLAVAHYVVHRNCF